ncbi:MAG: hypothetical protein WAT74_02820 [Flavobacteriales bacterium]
MEQYRPWLLILALACTTSAWSQTNPVAQELPYIQNFGTLAHNDTTPPAGWRGWRIGTTASSTFQEAPATANLTQLATSTAQTNTGGVHNYNGKLGILNSGSVDAAIVLSVNTRWRTGITLDYDVMTIRNPYNGTTNTRIVESTLQYRIGISGNFTTLPEPLYTTGTTTQTTAVTTPQNSQARSITLPAACDHQFIVQLRWVARDVSGGGARPSIAVDNISVDGACGSGSITYEGSPYCVGTGNAVPTVTGLSGGTFLGTGLSVNTSNGSRFLGSPVSGTVTYSAAGLHGCPLVQSTTTLVVNLPATADAGGPYTSLDLAPVTLNATANGPGAWSGGLGTFADASDPNTTYTPNASELGFSVELTWTTNDPDIGDDCEAVADIASVNVTESNYPHMFAGGSGRGDARTEYTTPPITADIYNGGIGRGDASDLYVNTPVASNIFSGGNGRGDVADLFVSAPIASSIFSGGNGRGDVADLFVSTPIASSIFNGGSGRGDVADLFVSAPIASSIFSGGNGRGDVADLFVSAPIASNIFSGGSGRGDVADLFVSTPIASSIFSGGNGRGDVSSLYTVPLNLQLSVKAFLEGPYDPGQLRMDDDLRALGLLPTVEPYSTLGYSFLGGGGESVDASVFNSGGGSNRIVDWVVVELRDAGDPTTIVASRCALIQRDGDVVGLDGTSALEMPAEAGTYFVSIRHRNHLGVMTANGVALTPTPVNVDFTQTSYPVFGTDARKSVGTSMVLWAGDVNFDGELKYTGQDNDRDPILSAIGGSVPTNAVSGYRSEDVNMDGTTRYTGQDNDRDPILMNIGGTVPTAIRSTQVP